PPARSEPEAVDRTPGALPAPGPERAPRLRAPLRVRRSPARRPRRPLRARPALAHGCDGGRPFARDGPEPADRRRDRRPEPTHRDTRASGRPAHALAGRRLLPPRARDLPARRLPARADRPLALADPGRRLRDLPLPEALHVALPSLAGGDRRSR